MGFQLVSFVEKKIVTGHLPKVTFIVGRRLNKIINFTLSFCSVFFVSLCFQFFAVFSLANYYFGNKDLQEIYWKQEFTGKRGLRAQVACKCTNDKTDLRLGLDLELDGEVLCTIATSGKRTISVLRGKIPFLPAGKLIFSSYLSQQRQ